MSRLMPERDKGKGGQTSRRLSCADRVRERLAKLGITEKDTADAVRWARNPENKK
jgi:cysteinyl-tRNA synthetase